MNELTIPIHHEIYTPRGKQIMRTFTKLREFTLHYNALGKKLIELERKNDKQFKEVFKIVDTLVYETEKTDEKVMGFIKNA